MIEQIAARLELGMAEHQVPGVAVGVLHQGQEHYVSRGVTSVAGPVPVDEDTVFLVGSTGKTVTATAVMVLVERGLLSLDEPVRRHVPELRTADPAVTDGITLRHCLTHTIGHEGDLFDDFGGGGDCLSRLAAGMDRLSQLAPPGTFSYSNAGFSLAGRAIEAVTGLTYERAMRMLVLDPLGMENSVFGAEEAITRRVAVGHRAGPRGPFVTRPWGLPRTALPAGGMASTVRDQLAWARFHLSDGAPLLSAETLRAMQSPQVEAGGGRATHIGISWLLQPTPGVIAHGGSWNGQESSFVFVPEKRFAVAVVTNGDRGALVHSPLVKWLLREVAGVESVKPMTVDADPADLPPYAGTYANSQHHLVVAPAPDGLSYRVVPTEEALRLKPDERPTDPMPLQVYADGRVLVSGGAHRGARGEFVAAADGQPRWLRIYGQLHPRL